MGPSRATARSTYNTLEYWQDLARIAERGKFDGMFLADIVGVYDVYKGGPDAVDRAAVQVPVNDPLLLVPAMAAVTKHLGFGVTANLTYEPPYLFARRMSTLDHLTKGRIGWNIVTGYLDSAARGMGLPKQLEHDERYDIADEYMEVVYKLWEGSWEDDAVLRDRERGIYADPAQGPSGQARRPALPASTRSTWRAVAAAHAGAVPGRRLDARPGVRREACRMRLRGRPEQGRAPAPPWPTSARRAAARARSVRHRECFSARAVVVGRTRKEAEEKYEEYHRYASIEGALAHFSSSAGIDFSRYDPDEPMRFEQNDAMSSVLRGSSRCAAARHGRCARSSVARGSAAATRRSSARRRRSRTSCRAWVEDTDIDGFNLSRAVTPESLEDFVDLVVPILQERGVYKRDYADGTLREKLFGSGRSRLAKSHPAASYRSLDQARSSGLQDIAPAAE